MANQYNKEFNNKIKLYDDMFILNPKKYKLYLLYEFSDRFKKVCKNQRCWLEQNFMKKLKDHKDDLDNIFRPPGPIGKFEWLNTTHILDTLKQYEKSDSTFLFLGAVPIDFDKFPHLGIVNLNLAELYKNNTRKIGCIFNLDTHDQDGSHWVSSFIDLNVGEVYYFDSYGTPPEPEIQIFLRRCANFIKKYLNMPANIKYNDKRHQYKDSECGVYSIHFIVEMISRPNSSKKFDNLINHIIDDKTMNQFRTKYFT